MTYKKYFFSLAIFSLTFCSCGQKSIDDSIEGLTIDPSIKSEVEKNISTSNFGAVQKEILIYENRMYADMYVDDRLIISTSSPYERNIFKSFYFWQGDTLFIEGGFGLFGAMGFTIKIVNDKATVYHMLSADDFPYYAYTEKSDLLYRLEVPCTETKIILSEIPDSTKKQIIYGYVEFNSGEYYYAPTTPDGQKLLSRKKARNDMKIYFKSGKSFF